MENNIPSALCFSHAQQYVNVAPGELKKIVVIQGSPRKEGTSKTDILTKAVVDGFLNAGANVETIYLREKKIKQCRNYRKSCWLNINSVIPENDT